MYILIGVILQCCTIMRHLINKLLDKMLIGGINLNLQTIIIILLFIKFFKW